MSVKITRVDGLKFKAVVQGHEIIAGRIDDKHEPEGMSPAAVMRAGLGLCTASRTIEQMMKRGWKTSGLELEVKSKVNKEFNRVTDFDIVINLEADLTEDQRKEILDEATKCFVANTIKNTPNFTYTLNLIKS